MNRSLARLILLFSIFLAGCGSLVGYMDECFGPDCRKPHERVEYFQAVRTDVVLWNIPEEEGQIKWARWASKPLLLIDFPISAVVDTVLLPFQVALNVGKAERKETNIEIPDEETPEKPPNP